MATIDKIFFIYTNRDELHVSILHNHKKMKELYCEFKMMQRKEVKPSPKRDFLLIKNGIYVALRDTKYPFINFIDEATAYVKLTFPPFYTAQRNIFNGRKVIERGFTVDVDVPPACPYEIVTTDSMFQPCHPDETDVTPLGQQLVQVESRKKTLEKELKRLTDTEKADMYTEVEQEIQVLIAKGKDYLKRHPEEQSRLREMLVNEAKVWRMNLQEDRLNTIKAIENKLKPQQPSRKEDKSLPKFDIKKLEDPYKLQFCYDQESYEIEKLVVANHKRLMEDARKTACRLKGIEVLENGIKELEIKIGAIHSRLKRECSMKRSRELKKRDLHKLNVAEKKRIDESMKRATQSLMAKTDKKRRQKYLEKNLDKIEIEAEDGLCPEMCQEILNTTLKANPSKVFKEKEKRAPEHDTDIYKQLDEFL